MSYSPIYNMENLNHYVEREKQNKQNSMVLMMSRSKLGKTYLYDININIYILRLYRKARK